MDGSFANNGQSPGSDRSRSNWDASSSSGAGAWASESSVSEKEHSPENKHHVTFVDKVEDIDVASHRSKPPPPKVPTRSDSLKRLNKPSMMKQASPLPTRKSENSGYLVNKPLGSPTDVPTHSIFPSSPDNGNPVDQTKKIPAFEDDESYQKMKSRMENPSIKNEVPVQMEAHSMKHQQIHTPTYSQKPLQTQKLKSSESKTSASRQHSQPKVQHPIQSSLNNKVGARLFDPYDENRHSVVLTQRDKPAATDAEAAKNPKMTPTVIDAKPEKRPGTPGADTTPEKKSKDESIKKSGSTSSYVKLNSLDEDDIDMVVLAGYGAEDRKETDVSQHHQEPKFHKVAEVAEQIHAGRPIELANNVVNQDPHPHKTEQMYEYQRIQQYNHEKENEWVQGVEKQNPYQQIPSPGHSGYSPISDSDDNPSSGIYSGADNKFLQIGARLFDYLDPNRLSAAFEANQNIKNQQQPEPIAINDNSNALPGRSNEDDSNNNNNNNNSTSVPSTPGYQDRYFNENSVSFLVGSDEAVNLGKRSFDHIKEHAFLDEPENKPLMMGGDYYDMNKLIKANARLSEGSIPDEFSADAGFESYEAIMETILNEIKLNNRFSMEILQEDGDELYELAQNIQSGKISSQTDTVRSLPEQEYQHQEVIAQPHYGSMPFKVAMTEDQEKQWSQNELEYIEEEKENIEREPQCEEAHEDIDVIETGASLQANTVEVEDADYDLLNSEAHEIKDPSEEVEVIKTNPHFEVSSSRVQFYDQAPQVINLNHLNWFQINPLNTIQEASPRNSTVLSEDSLTTTTQKTEYESTKRVQLLETEYIVKTKEIHEEIIIPQKKTIGQSRPIEGSNSIEIKSDNTYELLNYEVNQIPDIDTVDSKVEAIQEEQKHQEEIHQNQDVQELIKQEISKEVAKEVGQKVVDEVYQQVLQEQTTERLQQQEDQSMKTPTVIRSLYATWPDVSVEGVSEVSQPEDATEACEAEEVEEDPEKATERELDQEVPIDDKQFYQSSLLVHLNLGESTSEQDPNAHELNETSGSDKVSEVTHTSHQMVPEIEEREEICLENPIQAANQKSPAFIHQDDSGYSEAPAGQSATEVFEVKEVPKIYSVTQLQNITEIELREVRRPQQVERFRTVPIGDIREVSKIYEVPVVESYPQLKDRSVTESGKDRDFQNVGPVPQIQEIRQSRDEPEEEEVHNGAKDSAADVGIQDDEFPPPPEEDDLSRLLEENENILQESEEQEEEEEDDEEEGDGKDEKESRQNPQDQYYELQHDRVLEKGLELQQDLQQDLERDVQLLNQILQTERQASQPHDHKTDQNVQLPLETLAQQKHSQEDQHLEQLTDSKQHQPQNQQQSQVDQQQMEQEYHISQQANQERQYQLMQQQTEVKQRAQQERPEIQQSQQQTQEKQQQMQQEQEEKLPEDQQQTQEDLLLLQHQYQQKQKQYQQMQLQIQQNQQQLQAQQQLQSKKSPSSPLQSPTSPKRRFQPTSKSIMEEYHTQKKTDTVGDHLVASRLCDYDDENRLSYVFQQPRQDQDSSTSVDKVNAPYANVKLSPVSEVASPQSLALQMAKQRQESATMSKRQKENTLNPHSPNRKIVPLQMPSVSEQPKNKNENQLSEHQDISAEQSSLNGNQQPLSYEDILQKHNQRLADLTQQQKSNENGTQQQKSHANITQHKKSTENMAQHQKSSAQQDKAEKYAIQSNKYATLPTHFKKESIQSDRMPKRSASQRSPSQQHYQPLSQTLPLNRQRQIQLLSQEQQDHMAPVKQQQKLGNIKNVSNTSLESNKLFPLMPVIEKVGTRLSDYDDVNRFSMIMSKQLETV